MKHSIGFLSFKQLISKSIFLLKTSYNLFKDLNALIVCPVYSQPVLSIKNTTICGVLPIVFL